MLVFSVERQRRESRAREDDSVELLHFTLRYCSSGISPVSCCHSLSKPRHSGRNHRCQPVAITLELGSRLS